MQVLFKSLFDTGEGHLSHHARVDVLNCRKVHNLVGCKIRLLAVICGLLMTLWSCLDGVWYSDIHPSPFMSSMDTDLPDEISIRHMGRLVVWRCSSHSMLHRVGSQNILISSSWFRLVCLSANVYLPLAYAAFKRDFTAPVCTFPTQLTVKRWNRKSKGLL